MLWKALTVMLGLSAMLLALCCADQEMEKRQAHYRELLHTSFVLCGKDMEADLYCSYYVIGRRRRRSDLCLDILNDRSISKVHAILWYDNNSGRFFIAPAKNWKWRTGVYYPRVYVNGRLVPPEGTMLHYGDGIRMGNSEFMLVHREEMER